MPSFDIVSEVNQVELRNAVEQSNKEIANRFDFKGSDARVEQGEGTLTLYADDEFKLGQVYDVLTAKLAKRNVDVRYLDRGEIEKVSGNKVKQVVMVKEGVAGVRISGAKKDVLQEAIALVRKSVTDVPLQFNNFRD
jgi:hypothetical protein